MEASDWQLPLWKRSPRSFLQQETTKDISIDHFFDPVQTKIWTSIGHSPSELSGNWHVNFHVGGITAHRLKTEYNHSHFVQAVRSGIDPPTQSVGEIEAMARKPVESPQASPPIEITGKDGANMRLVQAGPFQMGNDEDFQLMLDDSNTTSVWSSGPVRSLYLDPFYLDQYEVTVEQYAKFLQTSKWKEPEGWKNIRNLLDPNLPIVNVNWVDAVAYCRWAGKRLPTEAEWEKAARGTDGRRYPWGDTEPSEVIANVVNNTFRFGAHGMGTSVETLNLLRRVLRVRGGFPADKSPYGIYDLGGNVEEWVADWRGIRPSEDRNPIGPRSWAHKEDKKGTRRELD